jgi:hypothetical protein
MKNLIKLTSKLKKKGVGLAEDLYEQLLEECLEQLRTDKDIINASTKANGETHGFGNRTVDEESAKKFLLFIITELRQLVIENTK